jgi:hypothetical protein
MSGGTTTTTSSQQQMNQIPQWVNNAGQQNYAFAQNVASQPLQQYQGQMVAGVGPQTQQAWNTAASSGNVGTDQYNAATAGYLGALGQRPMSVTNPGDASMISAGQLSNTNLQPYMNPFTQNVIDKTLPIMQQNLALSQNQQGNQANAANAFGGSRMGVQAGVTQAQGAQNMAQMAEQLNAANFGQAQSAAQQDIAGRLTASQANQGAQQLNLNRNLTAQQSNQAAQQAKINSDIAAAGGLSGVGGQLNAANQANFGMQNMAGAEQTSQAQNQINAQMAKFQQAWQYPQVQLGLLQSALGQTPYPTAQTSQGTQQQTTPTDWASLILNGAQAGANIGKMFGLGSDVKIKKNIASMGSDPATGVPIKSFRFKGESPSAPKTVGPLAQDIEKAAPGSTVKVGGIMTVPRPTLAKATPSVAASPSFSGNRAGPVLGPLAMGGLQSARRALANPRAGAKAFHGLANTKRPAVRGILSGGGG